MPIDPRNILPSQHYSPRTSPVLDKERDARDLAAPLTLMARYSQLLRHPLMCVDVESGTVLGNTHEEFLCALPPEILPKLTRIGVEQIGVYALPNGMVYFAISLPERVGSQRAAVGYFLARPGLRPLELIFAAEKQGWSPAKSDRWLAKLPSLHPSYIRSRLEAVVKKVGHLTVEDTLRREVDNLAAQVEYSYEEMGLLHTLAQKLHISRPTSELAKLSLQRMHALDRAEGHAIWLENRSGLPHFLIAGKIPLDEMTLAQLIAHFDDHDWTRPLVRTDIETTSLGRDFPGLRNFIIMPIAEGTHRIGWMASCNAHAGHDFRTLEASLLRTVASILSTHSHNLHLFREHEELLLSFVRSLVSSLDAKDTHTRGHSERVALIARKLGEHLNLPEKVLRHIYLAGLLHDIGKIGVDDRILRKQGELTEQEFMQVKAHPAIGASILRGLKNLQQVIPGVRHHHENYDGGGYPDCLIGEEIPLIARILSVADAFDAMQSDRPYRKGMPLERVENVLRHGAGKQWDRAVINAYFATRDEIHQLCRTYSPLQDGAIHNVRDEQHELLEVSHEHLS